MAGAAMGNRSEGCAKWPAMALAAAKAGLKAGDILISFDGKDIGNLYDFTYALQAKKPGDVVLVRVLRGTETIEAKVLLTERR